MIREEQNGTLSVLDASGKVLKAIGIFELAYTPTFDIMGAQIQANRENIIARQNYDLAVDNLQLSVNAGHTATAPPKPQMKVVSDSGEVSFVPFVPALKDLIAAPPVNAASSGSIKVDTPDRQAEMYAMLRAIYRQMFPNA
jgi:hypothetical protein